MPWEPGRRTPAAAPTPERVVWTLVRDARSARAVERAHPLGRELRLLLASELLWSRTIRPTDDTTFEAEAEAARLAFIGRGWEPAE